MRKQAYRVLVGLLLTVGALALGVVVAESALADPSSCGSAKPTIGLAIDGTLLGQGYGTCSDGTFHYMNGEIKWDKNFAPDPLVAKGTVGGFTNYPIRVTACDNRNTRSYYMRTYFTTTPSQQHDSDHRGLTPNC